ncbi:MAG: hypothetical protein JWN04_4033 [Myxococcaceae bacterium]|nr:hypothetical protein [Myxococcaceae bacterium]
MRARFRSHVCLPLGALLSLAACSELVPLGSECPATGEPCIVADDSGSEVELDAYIAPAPVDAGMTNVTPPPADADIVVPPDSSMRTLSLAFPPLSNPGFELSGGPPGDVTTVSGTMIAPWYTCQPIGGGANPTTAVRAESSVTLSASEMPAGATISSPDGSGTFISMQYLVEFVPIPLVQGLTSPLVVGEPYAFAIDVQSPSLAAELSLQVRGTGDNDDCLNLGQNLLVASDPIRTAGWHTLCLPFTSTVAYTHLVLTLDSAVALSNALNVQSARLLFDNVRAATAAECPEL